VFHPCQRLCLFLPFGTAFKSPLSVPPSNVQQNKLSLLKQTLAPCQKLLRAPIGAATYVREAGA